MNREGQLVSIVLTTLNGARYLRQAVDSCLEQTYDPVELIVVDGGSSDGTLDILATYDDPRIRIIHQTGNVGRLPGAINIGLDAAQGEFLTWMQADSIYRQDAIETMVKLLEANPDVGQVYADFWVIDADGRITRVQQLPEPEDFLRSTGDPAGQCFLIRHSVRQAVGPHDVTTHPCHDADYRWRIAFRFASLHIHEPLYYWRLHPKSLTGTLGEYFLARQSVDLRLRLGLLSPRQAVHELAAFDIADAFDHYQRGDFRKVPPLVCSGLRRSPGYARNRGVWSIFCRSLARTLLPQLVWRSRA